MSATKRARYVGPGSVAVFDSEASVYDPPLVANISTGDVLPDKDDHGKPIPARIVNEFLHDDNEFWTEAKGGSTTTTESKGDE